MTNAYYITLTYKVNIFRTTFSMAERFAWNGTKAPYETEDRIAV